MTMDEIIQTKEELNHKLRFALSTMERSDKIFEIKKEIIENQKRCPHFNNQYNWAIIDDTCPYCGFHFATGGLVKEW